MTDWVLTCPDPYEMAFVGDQAFFNGWACVDKINGGTKALVPQPYEAQNPYTMTLAEGQDIASAVILLWAVAWGIRQVIRVIRR